MENWDRWHDLTVNREDLPPLNKRVIVKVSDNTPRGECPDNRAYLEKISVWKKNGPGTEEKRAFRSYYQGGSGLVRVLAWKYEIDPDVDLFKMGNWLISAKSACNSGEPVQVKEIQLINAFGVGLALLNIKADIKPVFNNGVYSIGGTDWSVDIKAN